jgi:REP element-mobilizing transposase RayT
MVVEVTCRTVNGRFLLQPSSRFNRVAIGILARAQRMYDVELHAFCVMSNHYHLLLSVNDALQLARFMNFVQSNLAREGGRFARWKERFWSRRYQAILVSDERDAQLQRLRYILSQGCKEQLVARPEQWHGAQCVRELLSGRRTMEGVWIDRTAIHRNGGYKSSRSSIDASRFESIETLQLSPMPCFSGVDDAAQREWIRECVDAIADEARADRRARHGKRASPSTVRRDTSVVQPLKRRAAPWIHTASMSQARDLRVAYTVFLAAYRAAADKLKRGLEAAFPEGCFPPAKPFTGR